MRRSLAIALFLLAAVPVAGAQVDVPPSMDVDFVYDSGWVSNDTAREQVIIAFPVSVMLGRSLRLHFDEVVLSGSPWNGTGSILRVTSLEDGAVQTLNAEHVRQWQRSTAYFNGDTVFVEVLAQPGTGTNRLVMHSVEVGVGWGAGDSQCGATDDRVPSSDPRAGRLMPVICTAWMIDDCNHCFLSAGHCVGSIDTVQFNVPFSDPDGSLNHPPPQDQYAVDQLSIQSNGGQGTGNDWSYFGCFPNSVTGLAPAVAQGDWYVLAPPPPLSGSTIRITGYGSDTGDHDNIQQTSTGPFVLDSGTTLGYQVDTQGGNSGSPVIWDEQDVAIGIHTHGGCSSGSNKGTDLANHVAFQAALAAPKGICAACGPPSISQLDPAEMASFPPASLTIYGNNLVTTQAVTVGGKVYLSGDFTVVNNSRLEVTLDAPAALGVEQVTVANAQGTSNALGLTWVGAQPPVLQASPVISSGEALTWSYGGDAGDVAYLLVSFSPSMVQVGGHLVFASPLVVKVGPLDAAGLDQLTITVPQVPSPIFFYSQVATFHGGLVGASAAVTSVLLP